MGPMTSISFKMLNSLTEARPPQPDICTEINQESGQKLLITATTAVFIRPGEREVVPPSPVGCRTGQTLRRMQRRKLPPRMLSKGRVRGDLQGLGRISGSSS